MILDQYAISVIRQGIALHRRGYASAIEAVAWGIRKQASIISDWDDVESVSDAWCLEVLEYLKSEFVGTDLVRALRERFNG